MDVCLVCLVLIFVTYNILRLPFVCLLYNQICQVTECIPELVEDSSFTLLSLLRKWEEWQGVKQTAPLISGGMNALCLPAFSESFEDFPVIRTATKDLATTRTAARAPRSAAKVRRPGSSRRLTSPATSA